MKYNFYIILLFIISSCHSEYNKPYLNRHANIKLRLDGYINNNLKIVNKVIDPNKKTITLIFADSLFLKTNNSFQSFIETRENGKLFIFHWSQKDDPVWIGARIPDNYLFADVVYFKNGVLKGNRYFPDRSTKLVTESEKQALTALLKQLEIIRLP